jgi:DNA polymerase-1
MVYYSLMKRLVLIDGKSVFYRGYYAMPGLSLRDGTPTGGVFGFASLALEVIKKLEPDYVAVAWDKRGTNIRKRKEIYPEYKANRKPAPPDFYEQIPLLYELLEAFNWPLYELDDYEADDIMGAFAKQAEAKDIETCLITSDLDVLQCIGPLTHVYALKKGFSDIEQFDPEYFEQKYGINVCQFVDLKALKGDSSDNIPGVPGIGEKTAIQLLQSYETLEGIYEHLDEIKPSIAAKLTAGEQSAYLSKKVAEIWTDVPIALDLAAMNAHDVNTQKVAELLKRFEFNSLVRRLPKHMQVSSQGNLFDAETPVSLESLSAEEWPAELQVDKKPVLVYLHDDTLWLSLNSASVISKPLPEVTRPEWQSLQIAKVVTYDAKALYHAAHSQGVEIEFNDVHDLRQGAFLLDPLRRDRSLSGLAGEEIDETNAGQVMAVLWRNYEQQLAGFTSEPGLEKVAHALDFPLTYMLYRMEARGIKIDKNLLEKMSKELGQEHTLLEQEMYTMAGYEFNIGSPAQLSEVLFTKLQLPTAGIKKGKTGYSTGQKELDKLRGLHPIIELIERTRELAKLKNTYVDTLPLQTDEHSRLHTDFRQDVAATGRLSSNNPNLQNIPVRTDLGRRIREAFIPEEGNVFVSADYSQFELRLAAFLANDTEMIADFNRDLDIHAKTASDVYGIPLEEVTKNQRRAAKVINFGVLYGMSPHGLSAATGMSFIDAKTFIDQYFTLRAPIRAYIDETLKKAETDGYVETYFGRRRPTPDVKSSNFMVREGAKRAAANMPIQGTEADLMKMAMLRVDERLGELGEQVLQIHDSILVECPEENAKKVADILKDTMENIYPELKIRLKVDVATGKNWGVL